MELIFKRFDQGTPDFTRDMLAGLNHGGGVIYMVIHGTHYSTDEKMFNHLLAVGVTHFAYLPETISEDVG